MSSAPRLEVHGLSRSFGGRWVVDDVSLDIFPGQVTCLLGASGCGKTTTLRMIAGVEEPNSGEVRVDGRVLVGPDGFVPPEARGIGLMFQDFALFPHMTVRDNVAYGLRGPKSARYARVDAMLERVRMFGFGANYPHQLSGGEQQRVALARALAPRPPVMLMDEPFSGLDNRLRDGIRDDTLALLKEEETAVLLVTHEPEEAMRMGDEIALMRDGRIVQRAAPYVMYSQAVDKGAVAFFSDINVLTSIVENSSVRTPFGTFPANTMTDGAEVELVFRPQHVRIDFDRATYPPPETPEDGLAAKAIVERARFLGGRSLVEFRLDSDAHLVKAAVPNVFLPKPGTAMWLRVPRARAFVFPVEGVGC